ncbi:membrane or secreted protein [Planctomycetes bacterium TBK1r]|uniref:Uncharacterized protein n=1 Tax=Stieleria magnilauensis TaxID=2527963 RepID=A0ABX5XPL3_9BACT|nr:hypothetical protein TBK1r_27130 [Planctomycetes bacterium TBK1r]
MMIQPGMALAFTNDCGANCASDFMCEGCGCCEVSSPEEKCCCCGGGDNAEGGKSCCMGGTESEDSWDSPEVTQPEETLELQVIVLSTTEAAADSDDAIGDAAEEVEVTSTCGCGVESPPLGESAPARPTIPTRESVAIRYSDLADLFGGSVLPRCPLSVRGESIKQPRFSQIQLCIWRL